MSLLRIFSSASASGISRRTLLLLLGIAVLTAIGSGAWLRASILRIGPFGVREVMNIDPLLACSSKGTPFADIDRFPIARDFYKSQIIFQLNEREHALNLATGKCSAVDQSGFLDPGPIKDLAAELPGWKNKVKFSSFEPVLLEFERAYECRLREFSQNAQLIVEKGKDIPNGDRPETYTEEETRINVYRQTIAEEIEQSRIALERTLSTVRSFEMSAPITKELKCLQLESVDMRNGLTLLADAMSCMPRIWDTVTSLHDRTPAQ